MPGSGTRATRDRVRPGADKRARLIEAAADLAYRQGFARTTLADIAKASEIPLGNLYYYFKSKAEIGEAIAALRLDQFAAICAIWDAEKQPKERLVAFVRFTAANRDDLARSGCPLGSFCSELNKVDETIAGHAARPFARLLSWLEAQFDALGRGDDKRTLAVHLLSALQGMAVLASSLHDPELVECEAAHLCTWIAEL